MDKSIVTFSTWKRFLVETTALDSQDIFFGRYVVFSHNSGGFVDETGVGQLFSIATKFLGMAVGRATNYRAESGTWWLSCRRSSVGMIGYSQSANTAIRMPSSKGPCKPFDESGLKVLIRIS